MSELDVFLEKVHIKNYRSLRDVELPLKPLTVIVGPNASGKSNILSGLALLNNLMVFEKPPAVEAIQDFLWAGGASDMSLPIAGKSGGNPDGIRPSASSGGGQCCCKRRIIG